MSNSTERIDRRTLLRRSAIGGAVVWSAPIITTLGLDVAAAQSEEIAACPGAPTGSPPKSITFRWTGTNGYCSPASPTKLENAIEAVSPAVPGALNQTVDIRAVYGPGGNAQTVWFYDVPINGDITIAANQLNPNVTFTVFAVDTTTNPLRTVTIHTSCSSRLYLFRDYCGFQLRAAS